MADSLVQNQDQSDTCRVPAPKSEGLNTTDDTNKLIDCLVTAVEGNKAMFEQAEYAEREKRKGIFHLLCSAGPWACISNGFVPFSEINDFLEMGRQLNGKIAQQLKLYKNVNTRGHKLLFLSGTNHLLEIEALPDKFPEFWTTEEYKSLENQRAKLAQKITKENQSNLTRAMKNKKADKQQQELDTGLLQQAEELQGPTSNCREEKGQKKSPDELELERLDAQHVTYCEREYFENMPLRIARSREKYNDSDVAVHTQEAYHRYMHLQKRHYFVVLGHEDREKFGRVVNDLCNQLATELNAEIMRIGILGQPVGRRDEDDRMYQKSVLNAQFVVFNRYGEDGCKLKFGELEAITAGNASTYPLSSTKLRFRDDVQWVLFSRFTLRELYGKNRGALLEERFNVIELFAQDTEENYRKYKVLADGIDAENQAFRDRTASYTILTKSPGPVFPTEEILEDQSVTTDAIIENLRETNERMLDPAKKREGKDGQVAMQLMEACGKKLSPDLEKAKAACFEQVPFGDGNAWPEYSKLTEREVLAVAKDATKAMHAVL